MRTTLNIDGQVMKQLKAEAARRGRTMSETVEAALREYLRRKDKPGKVPELPTFDGGECLADVADRDALYAAMERA